IVAGRATLGAPAPNRSIIYVNPTRRATSPRSRCIFLRKPSVALRPCSSCWRRKRRRGETFMGLQTSRLGRSDLHITRVGFGSWAVGGGGWRFGWGPQDDAVSLATMRHALDLGVNWIDTAAVYGLGHSEEVVG